MNTRGSRVTPHESSMRITFRCQIYIGSHPSDLNNTMDTVRSFAQAVIQKYELGGKMRQMIEALARWHRPQDARRTGKRKRSEFDDTEETILRM